MIGWAQTLLPAAALMLARPAPAPPPAAPPAARLYPGAAEAVADLLRDAGGVAAFGEVHQDTSSAQTRSALARFTDEILPVVGPRAAHLVVETWVARGNCGEAEARVTEDVQRTTERPPETENEIVRLLRRAKEGGVAPHILEVTCDEYRTLTGGDGGKVDYDKLLSLTGRHLGDAARRAALLRRPPGRPLVLVYGGALHNDLYPESALANYSFGPATWAFMRGAYLEIDLYVPELVERVAALRAQPWYRVWQRAARPGQAVVIRRSEHSAIVVFPTAR